MAADVFPVIAEPTRRRILDELHGAERSVGELVEVLGVSQPTVSKHLKVLREAGLVTTRAVGQRRFYGIDLAPLEPAAEWIARFSPRAADDPAGVEAAGPVGTTGATASAAPAASAPGGAADDPDARPASGGPAAVPGSGVVPSREAAAGAQQIGRTVGRTVEQVTGRAQDLLDKLPKPRFGRRR
ncbi:ArsR/SmtB family transcription factor [Zafaria sp. Z1313]|uniref:ArsR/SmtB family transcription factor n=1 Tax=unclassified Zafaria TaxID=2828765 RepID=UPI002E778FFD|nr:metalloregulator ArsR/SmtB family transcription factor [Zafaria sp. J156]MEE1621330.1 metalloregulator ArsR/SmtB family transcription factor [Zafaria sp. J156]